VEILRHRVIDVEVKLEVHLQMNRSNFYQEEKRVSLTMQITEIIESRVDPPTNFA